ncbi:hypothetical protein Ae201684_017267 [Aphanomyces euteiches]|uniref:Uncharacterized protein n=1 Tax=Aphanomyces euteiches TaxID=100861 RepID=A0A6G0WAQ1_9STRA|nr:hypothetical protein Ae201684_017267 [Aphanomyces euteiches]
MAPKRKAKGQIGKPRKKQKTERMTLSRNSTCDASILSVMTEETIKFGKSCAFALAHSPVVQGIDADASLEARLQLHGDTKETSMPFCKELNHSEDNFGFEVLINRACGLPSCFEPRTQKFINPILQRCLSICPERFNCLAPKVQNQLGID